MNVIMPVTNNTPMVRRTYTRSTLFQGNGKRLLWEGLGKDVSTANSAYEVCKLAGLDYRVQTEPLFTRDGQQVKNMVATRRYDTVGDAEIPSTVYGAVTSRYTPVQNHQGFEFIDSLFGHNGFEVETAGQFDDGKIVWVEAKLPERNMVGEKIDPYLVFTNRHDGKGSVRIFLTPVRVVCKNTLNYAIKGAQNRTFSVKHTSSANQRLAQAKATIDNYHHYLGAMEQQIGRQKRILLSDKHVANFLDQLFPTNEDMSQREYERVMANREEVEVIYKRADDLDGYENSGFKFVNAVSDWATHHTPSRQTKNYRDNLFQKTLAGNSYIDAAFRMVDEFESEANKMIAIGGAV